MVTCSPLCVVSSETLNNKDDAMVANLDVPRYPYYFLLILQTQQDLIGCQEHILC